jgi:hypothetical protein
VCMCACVHVCVCVRARPRPRVRVHVLVYVHMLFDGVPRQVIARIALGISSDAKCTLLNPQVQPGESGPSFVPGGVLRLAPHGAMVAQRARRCGRQMGAAKSSLHDLDHCIKRCIGTTHPTADDAKRENGMAHIMHPVVILSQQQHAHNPLTVCTPLQPPPVAGSG